MSIKKIFTDILIFVSFLIHAQVNVRSSELIY